MVTGGSATTSNVGQSSETPTLTNANASAVPNSGGPTAVGPAENYGVYKHVDDKGRVTYTNFPVRGGQKLELDPLTVVPVLPPTSRQSAPQTATVAAAPASAAPVAPVGGTTLRASTGLTLPATSPSAKPAVAVLSVPSVDRDTQRKRDDDRRKILENELADEEKAVNGVQALLDAEKRQGEALQKTLAEMAAAKITSADAAKNVERNQQRSRSLQLTLDEHNRNIEALRKELGALR